MNPQQKILLATSVIRKGKDLVPDRFPQPNPETIKAWADALGRLMDSLPDVDLWEEAVHVWSVELVTDRMATPREIKEAVYIVRDRWEAVPRKARMLAQARERSLMLRDQQIAAGTFGQVRGYEAPRAIREGFTSEVPETFKKRWREVVGGARNA